MHRLRLRFPENYPYPKRHPFTVDPKGDWKPHTATLPKGCTILGTIASQGTTGALVQMAGTKNYCKVVNGEISIVNSLRVRQALDTYRQRELQEPIEMVRADAFDT